MRVRWFRIGSSDRVWLPNGDFLDRTTHTWARHLGYKYSVWRPGAAPSGSALWLCGGRTLAGIAAKYRAMGEKWEV